MLLCFSGENEWDIVETVKAKRIQRKREPRTWLQLEDKPQSNESGCYSDSASASESGVKQKSEHGDGLLSDVDTDGGDALIANDNKDSSTSSSSSSSTSDKTDKSMKIVDHEAAHTAKAKAKPVAKSVTRNRICGSRSYANSEAWGLNRLTIRFTAVGGWQMACANPLHNTIKPCTKELSDKKSGGSSATLQILKAWSWLGNAASDQKAHFDLFPQVWSDFKNGVLPSEHDLNKHPIDCFELNNIGPLGESGSASSSSVLPSKDKLDKHPSDCAGLDSHGPPSASASSSGVITAAPEGKAPDLKLAGEPCTRKANLKRKRP